MSDEDVQADFMYKLFSSNVYKQAFKNAYACSVRDMILS